MTPRRIRHGLIVIALVTAGFAPLVLLWGVVAPYDAGAPAAPAPAASATSAAVRPAGYGGGVPALAEFDTLWDVDLRRPLIDPALAVPSAPVVRGPASGVPLGLKLAGTVIEPGHSVAVFVTPAGRSEVKAVGEKAGAAEVMDIQKDRVMLRYSGSPITLKVEKESKP